MKPGQSRTSPEKVGSDRSSSRSCDSKWATASKGTITELLVVLSVCGLMDEEDGVASIRPRSSARRLLLMPSWSVSISSPWSSIRLPLSTRGPAGSVPATSSSVVFSGPRSTASRLFLIPPGPVSISSPWSALRSSFGTRGPAGSVPSTSPLVLFAALLLVLPVMVMSSS